MEEVLDIAKYVVPSLVVFVATYFVMKKFTDNEYRKLMLEMRRGNQKMITPLRLQSYERLVLFLERVSPNNLVMRVHKQGMSAKLLQAELVKTIKQEYEHNLTQQIYISSSGWEGVRTAKEEVIKVINIAGTQMKDNATGVELGQKIFEIMMQLENSPTRIAINMLKKEIKQFY